MRNFTLHLAIVILPWVVATFIVNWLERRNLRRIVLRRLTGR